MHPMLKAMNGRDFALFLRASCLRRRSWFNYLCVIGLIVAPILALVALGGDPSGTPFVLTASVLPSRGGPLLVSNRLAEPNYDVMLAWNPEALPAEWEAIRRRYFALDWIPLPRGPGGFRVLSRGPDGGLSAVRARSHLWWRARYRSRDLGRPGSTGCSRSSSGPAWGGDGSSPQGQLPQ